MNSFAWLQQHASTQGREKKRKGEKSLTKPTHLKSKHHFFKICLALFMYIKRTLWWSEKDPHKNPS